MPLTGMCYGWSVRLWSRRLPRPPADGLNEAGRHLTQLISEKPEVMAYLGRALAEGGAFGGVIFDGLVGISAAQRDQFAQRGMTRPDLDPDWAALNPLILRMGAIILRPYIERYLSARNSSPSRSFAGWDAAGHGSSAGESIKWPKAVRTSPLSWSADGLMDEVRTP